MFNSVRRFGRKHVFSLVCGLVLAVALVECGLQIRETAQIQKIAESVIREAAATTRREKVIALRDYLRREVTYFNAPVENRPWLRATAVETLRNRRGYCGEVTRAFICLARSLDIPVQRINLYGRKNHVVAEVDLGDEGSFLVDCQEPPSIPELRPLDEVLRSGDYEDYSTLNVRRLGLSGLVSRLKLRIGWLTDLTENPHAMMAVGWAMLLALLLSFKGARCTLRWFLRKRGWIHRTNSSALYEALGLPKPEATSATSPQRGLDAAPSNLPHA